MKKGFLLTLTLVTIALLCTSAYGVTITVDDLPDVIISDVEDTVGTIDSNFFRFTDVFNLDDIVTFSDLSSSQSLVKWSFLEFEDDGGVPGLLATTNHIAINEIEQNPGGVSGVFNPGAFELRGAGVNVDIQNIAASPLAGSAPFPDPAAGDLDPRWVDLIAAYSGATGNTSDTATIAVYSFDNDAEGDRFSSAFSPGIEIVYEEDDFGDGSTPDWLWFNLEDLGVTQMPAPASSYEETSTGNGDFALGFESTDTAADGIWRETGTAFQVYGSWITPGSPIDYEAGQVYMARWSVVTDQATAADQPNLRFRFSTPHGANGAEMISQTIADTRPAPLSNDEGNLTLLDHYWYPAQWVMDAAVGVSDGIGLAAEMQDQRPASVGKVLVAKVEVGKMAPPADVTPAYEATDFAEFGFAELDLESGDYPVSDQIDTSVSASGLSIGFPSRSIDNFRSATGTGAVGVPLVAGKLYRLTVEVSSGANDVLPNFRVRLFTALNDQVSINLLTPSDDAGNDKLGGAAIPGATAKTFVCYLPVDQFVAGSNLFVGVDAYGGSEDTPESATDGDSYDGTYSVTSLTVEELDQ